MVKKIINKIKLDAITPFLLRITKKGISIDLSERFVLFHLLERLHGKIEENPYLNFLSILNYQKSFEKTLSETVEKFYKKRNSFYFKRFFKYDEIYTAVKHEISEVYHINKKAKLTIFKNGLLVYDNYNIKNFNVLLLTLHSGEFVPQNIKNKFEISDIKRKKEEDIHSDKLYRNIVLEQGGIWINNKMSRFYCDLNRSMDECIYSNPKADKTDSDIWEKELTRKERNSILSFYDEFYLLLKSVIETYSFNIIFDGHTMRDGKRRPNVSFGTHYIPKFYLPIVTSLKRKIVAMGYENCAINQPYKGGHILAWISKQYPSVFTFSMEINKKLYLCSNRLKLNVKNTEKIAIDLLKIFDIQEEEGYRFN
ncbi:N-formylglutamate amidohydrolase [Patescibacteria group bacterium]|nr:N-formylglutamate amidohydrolase [Patescibacteria group bacterium]